MSTCITGYEMQPRNIDIALLGYTSELSEYGLRQLAENNKEQIVKTRFNKYDSEITLDNGTRITAIGYGENIRGRKFDQLMLFDDDRWLIKIDKCKDIRRIIAYTMNITNIPEEFQILEYEDIREE